MKLGIKQKIYGSILLTAAAAFVVDRVFFSADEAPPRAQMAAASEAPHPGPAAAAGNGAATAQPEAGTAPAAGWLAERLKTAAAATPGATNDQGLRDVFAAPASWRPAVVAPVATAAKPQLLGDQFRKDHHLEAVIMDAKKGRAIVDGQLVPVGGTIADFRLVGVTQRSAKFVHGDEQVALTLADAGDGGNVR